MDQTTLETTSSVTTITIPVPSCTPGTSDSPQKFTRKAARRARSSLSPQTTCPKLSSLTRPPETSYSLSTSKMSQNISIHDLTSYTHIHSRKYIQRDRKISNRMPQRSSVLSYCKLPNIVKEEHHRKVTSTTGDLNKGSSVGNMIYIPENKELKSFQMDYFRHLQDAALRRKALRSRKRWLKAFRKLRLMLFFAKNMAERCMMLEKEPSTYIDIGDSARIFVDYSAGRSIDMEIYKRKINITISAQAADTLASYPKERTLLQLEEARQELQKVKVFSEYPIMVQERVLRRAFYITIGRNRVILRQGHRPINFFIIICGHAYVKSHKWDEEKGKMVATVDNFIKTGDTFGSYALIHNVPRVTSVTSRTSMKLLAINGEDYLDYIFCRSLPDQLPSYVRYLSDMNFMENFPINLLMGKMTLCSLHHFKPNTVIADDSKKCRDLFIIKYGYCKVFRKLHDTECTESSQEIAIKKKCLGASHSFRSLLQEDQRYIERDSPYVTYVEMRSPAGHTVRLPVTKAPGKWDRFYHQPLTQLQEQRQFVPLMLMREGEVFGLDQTDLCPSRDKSRSTILVSLGAEVISLNKQFFCQNAANEAREVVKSTFIYDDFFIRRRLRERVNRDLHLEEVLKFYFLQKNLYIKLPQLHL